MISYYVAALSAQIQQSNQTPPANVFKTVQLGHTLTESIVFNAQ
jgi:hypothetical protein